MRTRALTGGVALKSVGVFDTLALNVAFHEYESDRLGLDYGDELNLSLAAKIKTLSKGQKARCARTRHSLESIPSIPTEFPLPKTSLL